MVEIRQNGGPTIYPGTRRIGTFVVSDRIWQNQSEFLREKFWDRIHRVTWDDKRYWITAESKLFEPVNPGQVIPDYEIRMQPRRGRRDAVRAIRQTGPA